jgi:hypothetical protein
MIQRAQSRSAIPEKIFIMQRLDAPMELGKIPEGIIVNASDKETMMEYSRIKGGVAAHNMRFHEYDNSGFSIKIEKSFIDNFESALCMFVDCIISKGSDAFRVKIPTDSVIRLIIQSSVDKGNVLDPVSIYYSGGKIGLIHKGMRVTDMRQPEETGIAPLGMRRTMKRRIEDLEIGRSYSTTYNGNIYLGDMYSLLTEMPERVVGQNHIVDVGNSANEFVLMPCLVPSKENSLYIDEEVAHVRTVNELYRHIEKTFRSSKEMLRYIMTLSWPYECLYGLYSHENRPQTWSEGTYELNCKDEYKSAQKSCMNLLRNRLNELTEEDVVTIAKLDFAAVARVVLSSTDKDIAPITLKEIIILRFLYKLGFRKYKLGARMSDILRLSPEEREAMQRSVDTRGGGHEQEYETFKKEMRSMRSR